MISEFGFQKIRNQLPQTGELLQDGPGLLRFKVNILFFQESVQNMWFCCQLAFLRFSFMRCRDT